MTGILVLAALLVGLIVGIVIVVRRRNARGGRSAVHAEDETPSPTVQ